jgi:predicted Zn-dependent protease with MMP-like domain/Flp pilus assembly protein TadD
MRSLDQAWELLDHNQLQEAQAIAEEVLVEAPEEPDALLLLAVCARQQGEYPRALALLDRIAKVDTEWPVPALWSAEILADDLGRPAEALVHATKALELADEEDEFLDAVALKAGLEIELGKVKAARKTLAELPPVGQVRLPPDLECDLAHLFFEAGDAEEANKRFERLVEDQAVGAHALYGVGLCAEARDDEEKKREAWLRVLDLDTANPIEDPRISEEEMAEIAESALKELPDRARQLLANIPILIVELPAREEVAMGLDPRLLGLFQGTSHSDPGTLGGAPQLTQILLFKKNLERIAADEDDLREQIRITLIHETGHFFGLDEEDLAKLGLD